MSSSKKTFHVLGRKTEQKTPFSRRNGYTLGNIFGLGKESVAVAMTTQSLSQHLKTEGETGLLYLKIDNQSKEEPVLISEIQRHPVTNDIIHISFQRVNLAEKITKEIDVKLEGVFEVPDATVLLIHSTLEVEALPADLPEAFVVDIAKLTEIGQEVHLADMEYDRTKVTVLLSEEQQAEPIALVQEVKEEVVEEVAPEAVAPEGEAAPAGEGSAPEPTAEHEAGE